MIGNTYIDGKDLYGSFGTFIVEGGYNALISYPQMGTIQLNNWPEWDGVEVDLTRPTLKSKDFALNFAAHKNINTGGLIEQLSDQAYHTFDFRSIGRTYKLRMVSQPNLGLFTGLETLSLQFADDFPLLDYTYQEPYFTLFTQQGYEIDGRPLSDYGVRVLQGSDAEIKKSPVAKTNLLRTVTGQSGAIYDGKEVVFQAKDVTLNCLMRAASIDEFWRNYNALLFDLVRPGERSFYADCTGLDYPCYYKSSGVSVFYPTGKLWCEFSIVLSFISFRVGADEYILASEAGEWLTLEEDGETAIDMGYGN